MKKPSVVIVGRINTGKSTLFNRLSESRAAIVSKVEGTTRDRNMADIRWEGKIFELVDTGGVDMKDIRNSFQKLIRKKTKAGGDPINEQVIKQAKKAIKSSSLIIFLVDGQGGITAQDRELAKILRKLDKPVILACNKIDAPKYFGNVSEFFKLGFGQPVAVSAINGSGSGDLLDEIVSHLKPSAAEKQEEVPCIRVSIVGKPNVGKSSLLNALFGDERVIVSDRPQTTREPQDVTIQYGSHCIMVIDTAGIKRKAKTIPGIDAIATVKSLKVLKESDISLFVLDATKPITSQDTRLSGYVEESLAGAIIVVNKWDLMGKKEPTINAEFKQRLASEMPPLKWAPIIFVSAKTGKNIEKILPLIVETNTKRHTEIKDKELERFLKKIVQVKKPFGGKGIEKPRIYTLRQVKTNPPEFTVSIGKKQRLHESYLRYIENSLRKRYDLEGINIKLSITKYSSV